MRRLLVILILCALVLGGLWAGGQSLLARELRQALEGGLPAAGMTFTAEGVTPLRDPRRFGAGLHDLRVDAPQAVLSLPETRIYVQLTRPNEIQLDLPASATVETAGQVLPLGLEAPQVMARLAPLGGMTVSRARIAAQGVTLDGRDLSGPLSLNARMVSLGADSPDRAQMAYDMDIDLAGLEPAALPLVPTDSLPLGPLALRGQARVWLDGTTAPQDLAAGQIPALAGLRSADLQLAMGDLRATVIADLASDAQGRAEGQVMIYSDDGGRLLDQAVRAGYLSEGQRRLVQGMLTLIAANRAERAETGTGTATETAGAGSGADSENLFRPAAPGELRLPLRFAEGRMLLGTIDLGPAPFIAPPVQPRG